MGEDAEAPPEGMTAEEFARFVSLWGSVAAARRALERPLPALRGRSSLDALRRRPFWRSRRRVLAELWFLHVQMASGVYL